MPKKLTIVHQDRRHRMLWHGKCYACICRVCNLKNCRYKKRWDKCIACLHMNNTAVLDCDGFESKYIRRVYHIKRDLLRKHPSMAQMIREMWESGAWRK